MREVFYQNIPDFWADLYGEPYALYDIHTITKEEKNQIRKVTKRVGSLFYKTADLLRHVDDPTLLAMGYLKETLSFLRVLSPHPESVIARLDLVEVDGTYKVLELNSDTPTFIKELFSVNQAVCQHFGYEDVNKGEEAILEKVINEATKNSGYLVFTSHEDNVEDRETMKYLQSLCHHPSRYVPLHKLQLVNDKYIADEYDIKIDTLYRQTFPIESLLLDYSEDGTPIGKQFLQLVEKGAIQIINPPSAFLLQNKAVQAAIWGLHEQGSPFFTEEEHQWIHEYFLPTYLEADSFLKRGIAFVKKPLFGREGDTIEIYNQQGIKIDADKHRSYEKYGYVYQQFVPLPTISVDVAGQKQMLHLMYGSFLLNGEPSSIGCRVGGQITDNLSYYLPLGIKPGVKTKEIIS